MNVLRFPIERVLSRDDKILRDIERELDQYPDMRPATREQCRQFGLQLFGLKVRQDVSAA